MKYSTAVIVGIIIAIALIPSYYFYTRWEHSQKLLKNPELALQEEKRGIVDKVGKLVDIPSNEDPTIATISDKDKLQNQIKNQPFFSKAENGDKVLVFPQAKKAILYRPTINKVMDMVAISLSTESATIPGIVAGTKVTTAIYNGTQTPRLANAAETKLTSQYDFLSIVKKDNAAKENYPKTLVIDVSGKYPEFAGTLAERISATVVPLPAGETKPDADLLMIVGEDFK